MLALSVSDSLSLAPRGDRKGTITSALPTRKQRPKKAQHPVQIAQPGKRQQASGSQGLVCCAGWC